MMRSDRQKTGAFRHRVMISVSIRASQEALFGYLTDVPELSRFFPKMEFRMITEEPLRVGSIYETRRTNSRTWSRYCVLTLERPLRISAMLVGPDPIFAAMRYDHRLISRGVQTISQETVDYTFRFGAAGRVLNFLIGQRLVRRQVLEAHLALKAWAEAI